MDAGLLIAEKGRRGVAFSCITGNQVLQDIDFDNLQKVLNLSMEWKAKNSVNILTTTAPHYNEDSNTHMQHHVT